MNMTDLLSGSIRHINIIGGCRSFSADRLRLIEIQRKDAVRDLSDYVRSG